MKIRPALSVLIASAMLAGAAHAEKAKTTVTSGSTCYNRATEDCNEAHPDPNSSPSERAAYDNCISVRLDDCDRRYPTLQAHTGAVSGIGGTVGVYNPPVAKPKTTIMIPKAGVLTRR